MRPGRPSQRIAVALVAEHEFARTRRPFRYANQLPEQLEAAIVAARRGLPLAIRSDNGVPFASPNGLFNLSKLSVWWLRLGIAIERIRPGHPQQNGRHERMHLTLKQEATRPAGANILQRQAKIRHLRGSV